MLCMHEVIPIVPTYLGIAHVPPAVEAKEMLQQPRNPVFCIPNSST